MAQEKRGPALTVFAVLFGILAISNFLKPFQLGGAQTGFVFFGKRLSGPANAIVGPAFGLFLLVYAISIWRMRRLALTLAYAYTVYVVANLALFNVRTPQPPDAGPGYALFGAVYALVAVGVSGGAALLLSRRKTELA